MKAIGIALALLVGLQGVSFATDEVDNRDRAAGIAVLGGWAATAATASTNLAETLPVVSAFSWVAFGIVAGTIREYQTEPERLGTGYRYNGQSSSGEDRKWTHDGRWASLKAYPTKGTGANKIPFGTGLSVQIPSSFVATPD